MKRVISNIETPPDRIRYALNQVNQAAVSWTGRELYFLVRKFFPAETRSRISAAAAGLCSSGEFSISGRRYNLTPPKPLNAEA